MEDFSPSCQADSENLSPRVLQSIPTGWGQEDPGSAIHAIDRADAAKTTPWERFDVVFKVDSVEKLWKFT